MPSEEPCLSLNSILLPFWCNFIPDQLADFIKTDKIESFPSLKEKTYVINPKSASVDDDDRLTFYVTSLQ